MSGEAVRQIVDQASEAKLEPPRPLIRQLPPADPFPVDALGDVLEAATRAINDRVRAPMAICGQSTLAAATLAA
jgi:putative DNA primase/helicase